VFINSDCNAEATITYNYRKKDTSLLIVFNELGTAVDKSQITQRTIQSPDFREVIYSPTCDTKDKRNIAALEQAKKTVLADIQIFMNSQRPIQCPK